MQHVAEWVGNIPTAKEGDWEYELPALERPIETVVVSLDGPIVPIAESAGFREAMAGTLSFYDHAGEPQHSIALAAAPEYGKRAFLQRNTWASPTAPPAIRASWSSTPIANGSTLEIPPETQQQLARSGAPTRETPLPASYTLTGPLDARTRGGFGAIRFVEIGRCPSNAFNIDISPCHC
jgi:hypothetical protein